MNLFTLQSWPQVHLENEPMATIYIIKGPNDGDAYTIGEDAVVIGRGDECSVTLNDEKTSRTHLQLTFDKGSGTHTAEDMRSTNGTWCNGKSLTAAVVLADGDTLEIGNTAIEYSSRTFTSNEAALAARTANIRGGTPTLLDDSNRPF